MTAAVFSGLNAEFVGVVWVHATKKKQLPLNTPKETHSSVFVRRPLTWKCVAGHKNWKNLDLTCTNNRGPGCEDKNENKGVCV